MNNEQLTGKRRYRVQRAGWARPDLVVLQVETTWDDGPDDFNGMPTYLSGRGWRDARPEDLQYLNDS